MPNQIISGTWNWTQLSWFYPKNYTTTEYTWSKKKRQDTYGIDLWKTQKRHNQNTCIGSAPLSLSLSNLSDIEEVCHGVWTPKQQQQQQLPRCRLWWKMSILLCQFVPTHSTFPLPAKFICLHKFVRLNCSTLNDTWCTVRRRVRELCRIAVFKNELIVFSSGFYCFTFTIRTIAILPKFEPNSRLFRKMRNFFTYIFFSPIVVWLHFLKRS